MGWLILSVPTLFDHLEDYEGALVMPTSFAVIDDEEMTYVEGGYQLQMKSAYLSKTTCLSVAKGLTNHINLTQMEMAKEIYAHAVMYYASPFVLVPYAVAVGGVLAGPGGVVGVLSCLNWIRSHSNPIDIGHDSSFRTAVFTGIWAAL